MAIDERIRAVLDGRNVVALVALIDDPQVREDRQPNVVLSVLHRLEELFYEGLPDLVVRLCVEAPEKTAFDARHWFLKSWLQREGYHRRNELIANLITWLRVASGEQLVAAIKTAWVVGYRDDLLQRELARIAGLQGQRHGDHNAEGYALAVLASMSYSDSTAIALALRSRLNRIGRLTEPDFWVAMYTATLDMIPALQRAAAASKSWGAEHALLELASRYPDAAPDVWEAFKSLEEKTRTLFASNVARRIDLEGVGEYLLSEVLDAFQQLKHRNVLPPANHLLNANLPNQIRVFLAANKSLSSKQRELLKGPAVDPTGSEGYQTAETLNREAAWNVILRLGLSEARQWLPEAMSQEANFTVLDVAEIASFLQVTEAVKPLARIVKDETLSVGIGVGCLKSLGILGTQEAFDALLESQVRIKHGEERLIPRALVKAIVSICMTLGSCELAWKVLSNPSAHNEIREACAYAIEDLSRLLNSPVPFVDDIIRILRTEGESLPGYNQLVLSLSRFKDSEALEFLRALGNSNQESRELTQALGLTGLLNEFPERIEKLGLKRMGEDWVVAQHLDDTGAFALLLLHRIDSSFELAVREVLADSSRHPAIQITANLRGSDQLTDSLRQALWEHALYWNSTIFADRSALEAVARTFPEKLLEASSLVEVSQWGSSARRTYLASLRTILEDHGHAAAVARIACQFLVDEESAIRRDAAWLARDSDQSILKEAVDSFATNADELESAIFMLDAGLWLEKDWEIYEERGRTHPEPTVREHAQRLSQERKDIDLARAYLKIILESRDYLGTWCFGQALLELGNEETIYALRTGLPPEVYRRAYLIWLANALEKRVEKRRQDQAEKVTLPPPASYEQTVDIFIHLEDERLGPFVGVLQERQSRRAHAWLWSWSIRIGDERDLALRLVASDADESINIETSDGRRGKVLPVRTDASISGPHDSHILLLGQGDLREC